MTGAVPRRGVVALLLAAALLGGGCVTMPSGGPVGPAVLAAPGEPTVRSELLCGRNRPDGSVVTDQEWQAFVAEQVTPRFPDGFTVLDAVGQYRDRAGRIVTEPSKLILLLHPGEARHHAAIQEIRDAYRRQFQQESVLLVTSPARASF